MMPAVLHSTSTEPDSTNNTQTPRRHLLLSQDFKTLTNIDTIRENLRLLDEEETFIDTALDTILSNESELHSILGRLDDIRPSLSTLQIDTSVLWETIHGTSHLAEKISDKVRQLDQEQSRAKEAIRYVEDVQELRYCVAGVQEAMKRKDYEEAAGLLQRASHIDSAILQGTLAEFTVPTSENPDHPSKTLADAKSSLFTIFSQCFDDAVAQRNETAITRYFKLFPLIHCQTQGLDKYSHFVCNIIKARCAEELKIGEVASPIYFADALTRLFENIAVLIDQHQPFVETHYGGGKMLRVIQRLQEEADTQSSTHLDRFLQARKLESKLVEIQSLSITKTRLNTMNRSTGIQPTPSPVVSEATHALVDPRTLDINLLELSLISQRSTLFHSFIHERANEEMETFAHDEKQEDIIMNGKDKRYYGDNGLLLSSVLTKRMKEVMNIYLVIDEYLLKGNVEKAMLLDTYDPDVGHTSTCVDDIFFILKKVLKRSITTCEPEVVRSTVRAVTRVLETGFLQLLEQKMNTTFSGHESGSRNAEKLLEQAKINYMVVLNNMDVSTEYTHQLVKELIVEANELVWKNKKQDIDSVEQMLVELEAVTEKFQRLLKNGIEQLMSQILKPRIRPMFQESYHEVKYVLDEEEYNEADVEDLFVKRFRNGFDVLMNLYRSTLTTNNFSVLVGLVFDATALQWERIIAQTRFNEYGALRFDKDLRSIVQYFSGIVEWLSRDRFTRVYQMSTLLNFEQPSEIYEHWGSKAGSVSWRLTVTEVKKIMALRLDFDTEQISSLSL
ncbi:COG4 transport protein-domain-containing protein [Spinellus fusiger]|nr:COG4 transport protein-domain-containing protein [Spinellus fusiger]